MILNFNEQQQEAINFYKGACGVVAGAGSGKTSVLINRIKNLIEVHNVPEKDILAVTFTQNTASEMKKKLSRFGIENANVGTFHAICRKILMSEGIIVDKTLPDWEIEKSFKTILPKIDREDIMSFISYQKSFRRGYKDEFVEKGSYYDEHELRQFYRIYEDLKKSKEAYDFDDQLLLCLDILEKNKGKHSFEFVLVDEHQDSNYVQNLLLKELCQSGNFYAVYDVKQSIYAFRGGDTKYAMNFDKDWKDATIINLYKNYRSTNNIVSNSNKFIRPYFETYSHYVDAEANNKLDGTITLNTYADKESEGVEVVDKIEELIKNGESLNNITVLYRLNSSSNFVENELKKREIEYEIENGSNFFKRKEIKGIIAYLRLLEDIHDDMAFEDIFKSRNYPLTFLSTKVFNDIKSYSGMNNLSMYEALIDMSYDKPWQKKAANDFEKIIGRLRLQVDKDISVINLISNIVKSFKIESALEEVYVNEEELKNRLESIETLKSFVKGNNLETFINYVHNNNTKKKKKKKDAVRLMSIHKSKGLEFKHTFLIGIEDSKFPHEKADLEEEARLFYVATTRSIENLYISEIGSEKMENQFTREYFA